MKIDLSFGNKGEILGLRNRKMKRKRKEMKITSKQLTAIFLLREPLYKNSVSCPMNLEKKCNLEMREMRY